MKMKLSELTTNDLIMLDKGYASKDDVFKAVAEELLIQGIIQDKKVFINALYHREAESPTGLENGIAIPHAKSETINKPVFVIIRLKNSINDWESLDSSNRVSLIFLLAIPKQQTGTTHIDLLAQLSRSLMNPEFVNGIKSANTSEEVMTLLELTNKQEPKEEIRESKGLILGVTACATGIAHTYMAAEALEKAGAELGYEVIVEKQGANGIEDRPALSDVRRAKGLIVATDIEPQNMAHYENVPYIKTKVAAPIKDAASLIKQVIEKPAGNYHSEQSVDSNMSEKKSVGTELYQSLMSGISYMIPIVVGAGLMTAIPQIGGMFFGIEGGTIGDAINATSSNGAVSFLYYLNSFGGFIFSLMYPVLAAFMANSIAGKVGMTAGFIGGGLAGGMIYALTGQENQTPSGFLGAIAIGFVAGYFCRFLNNKIKLPKNIQSLKPMLIIPLLSILLVYVLNLYIFEPIGGGLNNLLFDVISKSTGTYVIAIVIAMATAFDMGGPVNKAAFAVTMTLAANQSFPMTANILGCIIPPLGIGLSVILNQYVFKRDIYDESMEADGYTSFISGIIGISEGAIPFALKNPLITIPLNLLGSALAAVLATLFGVEIWFPIPQFWGWPLVQGLVPYLLSLLAGVLFVAIGNIVIRDYLATKKKKQVEKNDNWVRS